MTIPVRAHLASGAVLRNLRDPQAGADMRVDIALQGPKSRDILLALGLRCAQPGSASCALKRTELCDAVSAVSTWSSRAPVIPAKKWPFELFVHPDQAPALVGCAHWQPANRWDLKPCGLGARDSLRTEAGLPLYGHEMGGELNLGVAEAGFGSYVKIYKPWFIGRDGLHCARKETQGRGGSLPLQRKRCAHGASWRPGAGSKRSVHRVR